MSSKGKAEKKFTLSSTPVKTPYSTLPKILSNVPFVPLAHRHRRVF